jgi:hypothetical protein
MVTLICIDDHKSDFINEEKVEVPRFRNREEFQAAVKEHLSKPYDLIISDANPDGYISSILYGRTQPNAQYKCFRMPITKDLVEILERNNVYTIVAFDWFPLYGSDPELFDRVILINPAYSDLGEQVSVSEIIHKAIGTKDQYMTDIGAIGTVCSGRLTGNKEILTKTIQAHQELLGPLLEKAESGKLNSYHIMHSLFKQLGELFWAPYLMYGEQGVQELVTLCTTSKEFTYEDLFNYTHHPVVKYLQGCWHLFQEQFRADQKGFKEEVTTHQNVLIYEPKHTQPGFLQKFGKQLANTNPGKIILLKTRIDGKTKYGAQATGLLLDLGKVFEDMNIGGGHPESAGALVTDPELFEGEFLRRVDKILNPE